MVAQQGWGFDRAPLARRTFFFPTVPSLLSNVLGPMNGGCGIDDAGAEEQCNIVCSVVLWLDVSWTRPSALCRMSLRHDGRRREKPSRTAAEPMASVAQEYRSEIDPLRRETKRGEKERAELAAIALKPHLSPLPIPLLSPPPSYVNDCRSRELKCGIAAEQGRVDQGRFGGSSSRMGGAHGSTATCKQLTVALTWVRSARTS